MQNNKLNLRRPLHNREFLFLTRKCEAEEQNIARTMRAPEANIDDVRSKKNHYAEAFEP